MRLRREAELPVCKKLLQCPHHTAITCYRPCTDYVLAQKLISELSSLQVGQALALAAPEPVTSPYQPPPSPSSPSTHPVMGGLSAELQAHQQAVLLQQQMAGTPRPEATFASPVSKANRMCICSKEDPLRTVRALLVGLVLAYVADY
eukprot:1158049-Pelagomonas_calceolata.AAC.3